jgi:hypothetical protein
MPAELDAAIRQLDRSLQKAALDAWHAAGPEGRQRCSDFIFAGRFEWTRRLRVHVAVRRLIGVGAPWL